MIRLAGFAAVQIFTLVAFAGAAYGLGSTLLRGLDFASAVERVALSIIFGLGSLSTVFFLLACLHLFRAPVVGVTLGCCYLVVWPRRRGAADTFRRVLGKLRTLRGAGTCLVGFVFLAPLAVSSLYPPLDVDTNMYHLPAAKAFAAAGSIPALTNLRYPVFPQLNELLCAAGLLVGGEVQTPLLSLLWSLLVVSVFAGWSVRIGDVRVGAWSALLWLGSPAVLSLARSGNVEPGLAAFATAALLATQAALDTGDRRWLWAAGALVGWAAATKYTGLYFVVALGVVVLCEQPLPSRWKGVGAFALCALAAAGPWYVRNSVLSGNPVWPFLGQVFGYRFWTAGDVSSAVWSLRQEGGPHTLRALVKLPWRLAWNQQPGFDRLAPGLFALFPIGAVFALLTPKRRWLVALAVGFIGFWFLTTQQTRFLIPVVPAICLLTAEGVWRLIDRFFPLRPAATIAVTACALLAIVAFGFPDLQERIVRLGLPPTDERSRAMFLDRHLPSHALYRRLNQMHGNRYTVYAFHDESMKSFCDGTLVGDWFGTGRYADMDLSSGRALFASLEQFGAEYLLVNTAVYPTPLPRDPFFDAHFVPIFSGNWVIAFRLQ
jgi:hypothetical protein